MPDPIEVEDVLECRECGRKPRPNENAEDDWRACYEGLGNGVTLCPECAAVIAAETWARSRSF